MRETPEQCGVYDHDPAQITAAAAAAAYKLPPEYASGVAATFVTTIII